jgi:hypothetical protein
VTGTPPQDAGALADFPAVSIAPGDISYRVFACIRRCTRVAGPYGIAGDLSLGGDYTLPQLWAALRGAGFESVHYAARHDPAFSERSIAVLGPPGEQAWILRGVKDAGGEPIGEGLLRHTQERFGIFVVPTSGVE